MHATQSDEGFWRGRAEELQHALNSRVVVEQAKGVLAERLGLNIEGAQRAARRSTVRARESP
jgi:AmiR/NasT family two-component response regulator